MGSTDGCVRLLGMTSNEVIDTLLSVYHSGTHRAEDLHALATIIGASVGSLRCGKVLTTELGCFMIAYQISRGNGSMPCTSCAPLKVLS